MYAVYASVCNVFHDSLNNDFSEIECSELGARRGFLGISEGGVAPERGSRPKVPRYQFKHALICISDVSSWQEEVPQEGNSRSILSHKPTNVSEVDEREFRSSSSTEGPPGQTIRSWVRGADGAGNKLVVHFGRCLQIPEASRFLPGERAGPALVFGRIQRRENATDGPGRRHRGASDGSSQRASGGHP